MGSGRIRSPMDTESKFGLLVRSMKGYSRMESQMEKESILIIMMNV